MVLGSVTVRNLGSGLAFINLRNDHGRATPGTVLPNKIHLPNDQQRLCFGVRCRTYNTNSPCQELLAPGFPISAYFFILLYDGPTPEFEDFLFGDTRVRRQESESNNRCTDLVYEIGQRVEAKLCGLQNDSKDFIPLWEPATIQGKEADTYLVLFYNYRSTLVKRTADQIRTSVKNVTPWPLLGEKLEVEMSDSGWCDGYVIATNDDDTYIVAVDDGWDEIMESNTKDFFWTRRIYGTIWHLPTLQSATEGAHATMRGALGKTRHVDCTYGGLQVALRVIRRCTRVG